MSRILVHNMLDVLYNTYNVLFSTLYSYLYKYNAYRQLIVTLISTKNVGLSHRYRTSIYYHFCRWSLFSEQVT